MMPEFSHVPVMPAEVLKGLAVQPGEVVLDGTVGGGGHAALLAEAVGEQGKVIGLDLDPAARAAATAKLAPYGKRAIVLAGSYADAPDLLRRHGVHGVDAILLDLGVSSHEFDTPERGFSFRAEGPLDMRFSPEQSLTAAEIINSWPKEDLAKIIREYGEDRYANAIADMIIRERKQERILTTTRLAMLLEAMTPVAKRERGIHPATRTFQALRIAVNDELGTVQRALPELIAFLKPGGRIAIISFHSLEDRLVKRAFQSAAKQGILSIVTKKPLIATDAEVKANPRSRSAKLRIAIKL